MVGEVMLCCRSRERCSKLAWLWLPRAQAAHQFARETSDVSMSLAHHYAERALQFTVAQRTGAISTGSVRMLGMLNLSSRMDLC